MLHIQPGIPLGPKPTTRPLKSFKSCIQLSKSRQKLDVILENRVSKNLSFEKMSIAKSVPLKSYSWMKNFF